jgi:hypothetical protein
VKQQNKHLTYTHALATYYSHSSSYPPPYSPIYACRDDAGERTIGVEVCPVTRKGPTISSSPLCVLRERPTGVELRAAASADVLAGMATDGGGGGGSGGSFDVVDGGVTLVCCGDFTRPAGEGVGVGTGGVDGVACTAEPIVGDATGGADGAAGTSGGGGRGGSDGRLAVIVEVVTLLLESTGGAGTGWSRSAYRESGFPLLRGGFPVSL